MLFLGLHGKLIKSQDKRLALFTQATGTCLNSGECPTLGSLSRVGIRSPGRKVNTESLCVPRDQPEKEREGEGEKERET